MQVWIWMKIAVLSPVTGTTSDIVDSSLSAGHGHAWRLLVRTKTFSTHVKAQKCDDVRKSGLFRHAKTSLRNVAMPETGSDVLQGKTALTHVVMVTHTVETLVRRRGVQRAAVGAIWTDLDIIEEGVDVILDVFPAGIYGQGHVRISIADGIRS